MSHLPVIKIVTAVNWLVVAFLAYLVIAETVAPSAGGDAAGRGMGRAFYHLAIVLLAVLVALNLLPYRWSKWTAFGIVVGPVLFTLLSPKVLEFTRGLRAMAEMSKPIFPDAERDRVGRAIRDGELERLKELLQSPPANLNEKGEVLRYAVTEASHSVFRPDEKVEAVRLLLNAGARLQDAETSEEALLVSAVSAGRPALVRLLLDHGANPNVELRYFKYRVIFEGVSSHGDSEGTTRALLEKGADPEVTAVFDEAKGRVTPLYRAAENGRWGACAALIEKGANRETKAADGSSFLTIFKAATKPGSDGGYSKKSEFERLENALGQ